MTERKKNPHQGPAVADEDPDHSPMDEGNQAREQKRKPAEDQPGAEGFRTARADEDTYD